MGLTEWWRRVTGSRSEAPRARPTSSRATSSRTTSSRASASRTTSSRTTSSRASASTGPSGRPGRRAEPDPALPVMGVDACRAGWVGAVLDPSGQGTPYVLVRPTVAELVAEAGALAVVGVDIPVGLPDDTRREADVQARRELGSRSSTLFTTPVREAVYADSFGRANTLNRERLGSGVSQQAWALRTRIVEVDAWLRQDLPFVVAEVHPEVSFATMAGAPLTARKSTAEGSEERRALLARSGVMVPSALPVGVTVDDLVDACAAAWSAHRVKTGQARTFPDRPETFSDGLPAAIHA